MDCVADTTFLIDVFRERSRPGPATRFANDHPNLAVGFPWIVRYGFLRGAYLSKQDPSPLIAFLDRHQTIYPDHETILEACRLYTELRHANRLIGPHDIWIAACALQFGLPLLTRNRAEFGRVGNLTILDYLPGKET